MNRYVLLILTSTLFSMIASAQEVMSINEADTTGIDIAALDSIYKSGIHSDPSKAVFAKEQDEYIQAYYGMLHELSTYLNQNDFKWGGQVRCFNRIYFAEDGSIDYFLYKFHDGVITSNQESKFNELLTKFLRTYKFSLTKNVKFAQCSPVNYRDSI